MRIAIDARELRGKPTGVGRYLGQLLETWKTLPEAKAHEFIPLAPKAAGGTVWEQVTLPRLVRHAKADVLFCPGYSGPVRPPVPMVVAVHDVSFAAHPDWFHWKEGLRRRTVTRMAAQGAARVLTISEFSKGEIVQHLQVDPGKVEVVYPGVTTIAPVAPKSLRPPDPVILFVGSIFNRRHIPELIDGFARLARRTPRVRLEIVGDNRTMPHVDLGVVARKSGVLERIGIQSYVSDEELGQLYRHARVFAFLSDYEGFGMTPVDALAGGIPIVVLDTPVAREIYGNAAIYIDRPEPELIETALEQALSDERERAHRLAIAPGVLARYTWKACAQRVLTVLEEAARHEPPRL
jgi:glycosyltransferase involved in cell wall biosynthesis